MKPFIFFISIFLVSFSSIQSDSILDLIETTGSTYNPNDNSQNTICSLNENDLRLLFSNHEQLQSQQQQQQQQQQSNNLQKFIIVKSDAAKDSTFIDNIRLQSSTFGYQVCVFHPTTIQFVESNITVVNNDGYVQPYYGRHDISTFMRFLANLEQHISKSSYQTIAGKLDKKAYEHVYEPKIIAYYPDVTAPAFKQFQIAAKLLSPNPPFFVVHDPQLAAKFRLNQPGQISLVRRLEKSQIFFSPSSTSSSTLSPIESSTITAQDIVQWIKENHGLVMNELKDTNLYNPEIHDPNKYQLVAVGDKTSPLGLYFFKILTKTIQNISRENDMKLNPSLFYDNDNDNDDENDRQQQQDQQAKLQNDNSQINIIRLDDIKVVWIDSQQFPSVALNLKNKYKIQPVKDVWFGLVHSPPTAIAAKGLGAVWFDLNNLNLTRSDHHTDQENIWLLRNWIMTVTDREAINTPENLSENAAKSFILEPESVSVRQNGNFLLECRVQSHLKCSWLKDSHPIIVDNIKYRYINNNSNGDCSIMVNGAQINQDQGEWICTVDNSGEKSAPVLVNVRSSDSTKIEF